MPYCPDCLYIYRDGVEICPDCGAELLEEETDTNEDGLHDSDAAPTRLVDVLLRDPDVDDTSVLVSVFPAEDPVVAELVHGVLTAEGIHSVIHSEEVAALPGVLGPHAEHWGEILVPELDAAHAREVISAYLVGRDSAGNLAGGLAVPGE